MIPGLVSVIIPTYKRSDSLLRTIYAVLNQTYPSIEIIVVDDNGEGTFFQRRTEERLTEYIEKNKVKYIKHPVNKNGSAARNTGFWASNGEYINFLDDDDLFLPMKIERQVLSLQNSSAKVGATYCNSHIIYKTRFFHKIHELDTENVLEGNLCEKYLLGECHFNTSAIMFKRAVIENLNGFDESFRRHQDYELMVRFFDKYSISCSSVESLMVYDLTQPRTFTMTGERDYHLKLQFLGQFAPILEKMGILNSVSHHMWIEVIKSALRSRQYKIAAKAFERGGMLETLKLDNLLSIFKSYFYGLLNTKD